MNIDLALRVLAHIEDHPDQWNQQHWSQTTPDCGTSFCFAGWAVAIEQPGAIEAVAATAEEESCEHVAAFMLDDEFVYIPDHAAKLLELTPLDREERSPLYSPTSDAAMNHLFRSTNTLEDLYAQVSVRSGMTLKQVRDGVRAHRTTI